MRKTARTVVWEGAGAQSPAPDPIAGPSELPRGFGVRWLAGNGADTALEGLRRVEAKAVCALTPPPPHSKTLARYRGSCRRDIRYAALGEDFGEGGLPIVGLGMHRCGADEAVALADGVVEAGQAGIFRPALPSSMARNRLRKLS